jgi:hypothetical protein
MICQKKNAASSTIPHGSAETRPKPIIIRLIGSCGFFFVAAQGAHGFAQASSTWLGTVQPTAKTRVARRLGKAQRLCWDPFSLPWKPAKADRVPVLGCKPRGSASSFFPSDNLDSFLCSFAIARHHFAVRLFVLTPSLKVSPSAQYRQRRP